MCSAGSGEAGAAALAGGGLGGAEGVGGAGLDGRRRRRAATERRACGGAAASGAWPAATTPTSRPGIAAGAGSGPERAGSGAGFGRPDRASRRSRRAASDGRASARSSAAGIRASPVGGWDGGAGARAVAGRTAASVPRSAGAAAWPTAERARRSRLPPERAALSGRGATVRAASVGAAGDRRSRWTAGLRRFTEAVRLISTFGRSRGAALLGGDGVLPAGSGRSAGFGCSFGAGVGAGGASPVVAGSGSGAAEAGAGAGERATAGSGWAAAAGSGGGAGTAAGLGAGAAAGSDLGGGDFACPCGARAGRGVRETL